MASSDEDIASCRMRLKAAEEERDSALGFLKAEKGKREAERAGRVRAEATLRKALAAVPSETGQAAGEIAPAELVESEGGANSAPSQARKHEGSLIPIREIGCIQSCYRRRFGTPRQVVSLFQIGSHPLVDL